MYERRVHVKVGSSSLPSFSQEDLLLILCFHCVKNRWERLKHMVDIAEFICNQSDLDWNRILFISHKLRCEKILFVSLALTRATVGLELPQNVLERLDAHPKLQVIAKRAVTELPERMSTGVASFSDRFRDNLTVLDTRRGKLRYITMAIFRRVSDLVGSNLD